MLNISKEVWSTNKKQIWLSDYSHNDIKHYYYVFFAILRTVQCLETSEMVGHNIDIWIFILRYISAILLIIHRTYIEQTYVEISIWTRIRYSVDFCISPYKHTDNFDH